MAYDPASASGRVRLLINDVREDADPLQVFTDAEITAFLAMGHDRPTLGAAIALETIASNEALVLKVITTQDLTTDGAKVSDALLKRAATLRKQDADDVVLDPETNELDMGVSYPVGAYGPELSHTGVIANGPPWWYW